MERTLKKDEKAYKNMMAVAKMLEAVSPNNARYEVADVYLDFGQNWIWTTIVRKDYLECQVLSPAEWREIFFADTVNEIAVAVNEIRNGKYFGDI